MVIFHNRFTCIGQLLQITKYQENSTYSTMTKYGGGSYNDDMVRNSKLIQKKFIPP